MLLPKDYVRLWLTGQHATDMSDAAGTLWLDVGARRWSDALLAATGLSRDQMPEVIEGTAQSGLLRAAIAEDWGVARVPVAGAAATMRRPPAAWACSRPGPGS